MKTETAEITRAASDVLHRMIGPRAQDFDLQQITPDHGGRDVYEVEARGGRVTVHGSSGVALTRGAYDYLHRACGCHVSWEGARLDLPPRLPDHEARVVSPFRHRHYYNVCTFGYTTLWWDWPRWEREIDWMALHGINMPLSLLGQYAIWQRLWRELGVSDEELTAFFNGPAFGPWFWMGNVFGHATPLPQHWIDSRRELQKKIMARQLELGMTPIVPGFAGHVPPAFARARPDARLLRSEARAYSDFTVPVLDPREPVFKQIGQRFVSEYAREYGTAHFYLADTFNELLPPFKGSAQHEDLAAVSRAVFEAMAAADPEATLCLQGWTFGYFRDYWSDDVIAAYLSGVPEDRLIVLDLSCDTARAVPRFEPLRRHQWIFCILHNFGHSTPAFGNLSLYAAVLANAARQSQAAGIVGAGSTPEGIEQNSIVYELVFDMTWRDDPPELGRWLRDYARCRYGSCPEAMAQAWDLLERSVYRQTKTPIPVYIKRPLLDVRGGYKENIPYDRTDVHEAVKLFLACADELGPSDLYRRDLVDILKQHLANEADRLMAAAAQAYRDRDAGTLRRNADRFLALLDDIDTLLETRPEHRLARWVKSARQCAVAEDEADHYEYNARLQVTRWGGPRSLTDYAHKEWSGLIRDYDMPRWRLFFDRLLEGVSDHSYDEEAWHEFMDEWEARWPRETRQISAKPAGDVIDVARHLFECYGAKESFDPA